MATTDNSVRAALAPVLRRLVDAGDIVGGVGTVATSAVVLFEGAAGSGDTDAGGAMAADAMFWIASMTKAITSAAVMCEVEHGTLKLDEPVGELLPELRAPMVLTGFSEQEEPILRAARRPITLRHLLAHTSGHGYVEFDPDIARYCRQMDIPGLGTCRDAALMTPLIADPGERWSYGIGTDWAGKALERASGTRLRDYLRINLFEPLGMVDATFEPDEAQRRRRVAIHQRQPDGSLAPIDLLTPVNGEFDQGGGGIYATASDCMKFCRMLLRKGTDEDGAPVLQPSSVAQMFANQVGALEVLPLETTNPALSNRVDPLPGVGRTWGFGLMINTAPTPEGRSAGSATWGGLLNTLYWIDPARDVAGILFVQQLPFLEPRAQGAFRAFERATYAALDGTDGS